MEQKKRTERLKFRVNKENPKENAKGAEEIIKDDAG
jgi:hypothetical protein